MKIGIVGSGKIGGVVGKLWAQTGHHVRFSSRHPEGLDALVAEVGSNASCGTIEEALAFGDVILLSIPYGAVERFGQAHGARLQGKIVVETGNPYPERDGAIADEVRASGHGTGIWSARWLRGARLVRGFNSVWDQTLAKEAHRPEPRVGIPLASDDAEALEVVARLVRDAGFDPVIVGPLARAREFDVGTPVYASDMSGPQVRDSLGLVESEREDARQRAAAAVARVGDFLPTMLMPDYAGTRPENGSSRPASPRTSSDVYIHICGILLIFPSDSNRQ